MTEAEVTALYSELADYHTRQAAQYRELAQTARFSQRLAEIQQNVNSFPLLNPKTFVAPANTRFIGNHQFGKKLPTSSPAINAEMETWAKKCSACWNGTNTNYQQCNDLWCYGPGI